MINPLFDAVLVLVVLLQFLRFYLLATHRIELSRNAAGVRARAEKFYWRYKSVSGINRQLIKFKEKSNADSPAR